MARRLATVLILVSAIRVLLVAHEHQPIERWMLWPVLGYWFAALAFAFASLGLGLRLLWWLGAEGYSRGEQLVLGFALGVFAQGLLIFGVGLFSLSFGVACALTLGSLLIAGRAPFRLLWASASAGAAGLRGWSFHPLAIAVLPLSVLVLAAVYIPVLNPQNLQHDARWYHLPIAAQYVAQGKITPFVEGWILGTYPHLSSWLFTWALLFPVPVIHGIGIAAHIEVVLFIATLVAVPLGIRRVAEDGQAGYGWAAFFLFPGFLVYDAALSLGADHIAALWALPMLLVLLELWRGRRKRDAVLLGVLAAAAASTKYSALCLLIPIAIAVAVVGLGPLHQHVLRLFPVSRIRELLRLPPAASATSLDTATAPDFAWHSGVTLALSCVLAFGCAWAPHWLKNWLWYGDPVYPVLHDYLSVHPWNASTERLFEDFNASMVQHGPRTLAGLLEALGAAVSYGFETREFDFHGQRPVFGFLFAALLPALPFARAGRRSWSLAALIIVGLMAWYLTYTRDRYLQALLPWMVVFAAVLLRACWHGGSRALRAAVVLLVSLQVIQGLDVFFLRSHVMARGHHPFIALFDQVTAGFRGGDARPAPYPEWAMASWVSLGQRLPAGAKLLSHRERMWTGVGVPVVLDESSWQAGIDYDRTPSRAALLKRLRALGITHVVAGPTEVTSEYGPVTVGGELLLWDLLRASRELTPAPLLRLWELPRALPEEPPTQVALWSCAGHGLPSGVYTIAQLGLGPSSSSPAPLEQPSLKDVESGLSTPPFAVALVGCDQPPARRYGLLQHFGRFNLLRAVAGAEPDHGADQGVAR